MAAGYGRTLAVDEDGDAWYWGPYGIMDGTESVATTTPRLIPGLDTPCDVALCTP